MAYCINCNKRFPNEHEFRCMLGSLCPPCQVNQKRFSGKIWYKLVEYDFEHMMPDYICNEGFGDCDCASCQYNKERDKYKKVMEEEEKIINEQIQELAKLYPGAYHDIN